MISQLAKDDLEQLRAEGLNPSIEDIIRLNALGLKLEAEAKKRPVDSTDYLPRVAVLRKCKMENGKWKMKASSRRGRDSIILHSTFSIFNSQTKTECLTLRQPAIGHEIWLEKMRRFVADDDTETTLALHAFALSRAVDDLPDADDVKSVEKAAAAFCEECRDFTRDQIFAAVEYATFGASPLAGEYAELSHKGQEEQEGAAPASPALCGQDSPAAEDWRECVAAGVLAYGQTVLFGASVAELSRMTRRQVCDMIRRAYVFHGLETPDYLTIAQGDYYATLTAIRERLTKK